MWGLLCAIGPFGRTKADMWGLLCAIGPFGRNKAHMCGLLSATRPGPFWTRPPRPRGVPLGWWPWPAG